MHIGILALQGDFAEHSVMLRRLGVTVMEVRLPEQLEGLSGLIIPGGESTTIAKLAVSYGFMDPLRRFGQGQGDLGYLCRGDFSIQGCAPRPASPPIDGYHSGA